MTRDARGRFAPGNKGGPGNPHASRVAAWNQAIRDAASPAEVRDITRRLVRLALGRVRRSTIADQIAAARVVLDRSLGKVQTPAAGVRIPDVTCAADLPAAFAAVLKVARSGQISIEQTTQLIDLLDRHRAAFGEADMFARVAQLREELEAWKGDQDARSRLRRVDP